MPAPSVSQVPSSHKSPLLQSIFHVRDHSKATGPAHHLLEYIAQHVNEYTGEAFQLTVDRIAYRLQVTPEWVRRLKIQLVATGELLVQQSRGRHPNVYVIPWERCPACQGRNPQVTSGGGERNPQRHLGVEDPTRARTPKQPPSNPQVGDGASPEPARIAPQKSCKGEKEPKEKNGVPNPQPPTAPRVLWTPPPTGEARRQLIAELTAWAQEETPGVNALRLLNVWLYRCEGKQYRFPNWVGEGKAQLADAFYARQEQAERSARLGRLARATPTRPPAPDDHEWADPRSHVSEHLADHGGCGMVHQRTLPCPVNGG